MHQKVYVVMFFWACHVWKLDAVEDLSESTGCWRGVWASMRDACCGPPVDHSCFDMQFDEGRCCGNFAGHPTRESVENCLPFDASNVSILLSLSVGVDAHRLSTSSRISACTAVGWKSLYALLRIGPIEAMPGVQTRISEMVVPRKASDDRDDGSRPPKLQVFHSPLQPLLLCMPESCTEPDPATALLAFVAEHSLPASVRPGRLLQPTYLLLKPLPEIAQQIDVANTDAVRAPKRIGSLQCRSGACHSLFSGSNLTDRHGMHLPSGTELVIDIGAHACTEFFEWLERDPRQSRWVLAIEPDPDLARKHPFHPRLAVLQAAVGDQSNTGWAMLHRTKSGQCNSLLPFPQADAISDLLQECFSRAEPVSVPLLSLAAILGRFAPSQEVDFLKIDAQGSDLAIITSAGVELRRVRWLQVEAVDLPQGHLYMPYGPTQPGKEDIVLALAARGFVLDDCRPNVPEIREENCLFVRADILEAPPSVVISSGAIRWDRP